LQEPNKLEELAWMDEMIIQAAASAEETMPSSRQMPNLGPNG